jgi:hypothetical protein
MFRPVLYIVSYILCFNIIKIVTVEKGPLRFYLLGKVFVLIFLRIATVQAKTCSVHIKVTS